MGVNGRGEVLARSFATAQNSEVAYIVDVDTQVAAPPTKEFASR